MVVAEGSLCGSRTEGCAFEKGAKKPVGKPKNKTRRDPRKKRRENDQNSAVEISSK